MFSCCKAFTGNSFPVEFLPRVGLRILTRVEDMGGILVRILTRVEDMGGILVFYWFFIILEATTYAFKLQLHAHSCF